jgi:hypothetical protein
MDKATETQLSLYLDGLLPDEESRAFEVRMEQDAELRRAVALHREAAGEMRSQPELPAGFTARARARLERQTAAAAAPWWHRFWSLETAGVLVSAGIIMLAIVPFLLQPDREVEEVLVAQSEMGRQEALFDRVATVPEPSAAAPGRGDAAPEEIAAETATERQDRFAAVGHLDDEDGTPIMLNEGPVDSQPAVEQKKRATELKDSLARERALATPAPLRADAGNSIRSIPVAGTVDLTEAGYIVVRSQSELDALLGVALEGSDEPGGVDGKAGEIDFDREMGILLPTRRDTPEPVRIVVLGSVTTDAHLMIFYTASPAGDEKADPTTVPPRQLIIVPASDLPVQLRKLN